MGMTIAQFKALKTKADTEWKRRKYHGSMTEYADDEYTADAEAGKPMRAADGNLVMTPFTSMVTHGNLATSSAGTELQSSFDNNTIDTWLTALASRAADSETNDCNSACSGLCVSECSTGCSSSCTTGCTSCSGTCSSTCSGGCSGGCSGCSGGCSGCGGGCASTCSGTCSNCAGANCSSSCSGNCSSCTGCTSCKGCTGGCEGTCQGHCQGGAKIWV